MNLTLALNPNIHFDPIIFGGGFGYFRVALLLTASGGLYPDGTPAVVPPYTMVTIKRNDTGATISASYIGADMTFVMVAANAGLPQSGVPIHAEVSGGPNGANTGTSNDLSVDFS